MKKIITLLLVVLFCLNTYSCKRSYGCDDDTRDAPLSLFDSRLVITFKDKSTGDFLIKGNSGTYAISDIKILDENQKEVSFNAQIAKENQKEYYVIHIPVLASQPLPEWGQAYTRRLYIHLKGDIDTLDYTFKAKALPCGSKLEQINVKYNDLELNSIADGWYVSFDVNK
ncbi:hypothetical protein [Pedobacter sp.]|uniref:hypothetical protein n=1 Tax=Pedobacter sp. TaxID=1411316 RepID=UPI0031E3F59E